MRAFLISLLFLFVVGCHEDAPTSPDADPVELPDDATPVDNADAATPSTD